MDCVLGLDVGQSGVRACVEDVDGAVHGRGRHGLPPPTGGPGRAEHDPMVLIEAAFAAGATAVAEAVGRRPGCRVVAVCVEGFGPAPTLLDGSGEPLTPTLLYRLDARAEAERCRLEAEAGLPVGALGPDHALPKLTWWRRTHPELWSRVRAVVDAAGLIVTALTGRPVIDEITRQEYYDLPGADGRPELAPLPPARPPREVAGRVSPAAGSRLGVTPGADVLVGSIDSFVDLWAAGLREIGHGGLVCGSTGVGGVAVGRVPPGHGLVESAHLGAGRLIADWSGACTTALHWVRRLVGAGGEIEVEIAERRPGDSGVIAVPRLAPSATGPTGGVLAGLTLATTPADVHRAVVDGIALDLAGVARRSRRLGLVVDCWFGWGGGLGIAVLRQAVADALQAPLALCAPPGAVVAAADLAREVALGGAPRSVQELVQPDPGAAEAFADLAARTDELIRAYPGRLPRTDHRAGRPAREEEATCPD